MSSEPFANHCLADTCVGSASKISAGLLAQWIGIPWFLQGLRSIIHRMLLLNVANLIYLIMISKLNKLIHLIQYNKMILLPTLDDAVETAIRSRWLCEKTDGARRQTNKWLFNSSGCYDPEFGRFPTDFISGMKLSSNHWSFHADWSSFIVIHLRFNRSYSPQLWVAPSWKSTRNGSMISVEGKQIKKWVKVMRLNVDW